MSFEELAAVSGAEDGPLWDILRATGSKKYHIEYNGYFSNHLSHALVSLHRLGQPKEVLDQFHEYYKQWLEPAIPSQKRVTEEMWETVIGERKWYTDLVDFFTAEHTKLGSTDALLAQYVPRLLEGLSGAAFHGLIELGFTIESRLTSAVLDGLAYMCFAYRSIGDLTPVPASEGFPTTPSEGTPIDRDICTILKRMREEHHFDGAFEHIKEPPYRDLDLSDFQKKMMVLGDMYPQQLQYYLQQLDLWDLHDQKLDDIDFTALMKKVFDSMLTVYSTARNDDFFLLHGVTSSFAMTRILPYLPSPRDKLNAIFYLVKSVAAVYLVEDAPILEPITHEHPLPDWLDIIQTAVDSKDEHTIKVVYACHDFFTKSTHADEKQDYLYQFAAACRTKLQPWKDACKQNRK
eukprot:GILJ01003632.1.p1 GENE.GILJ01003632.1~~GILJ01003632.1.p1  ORF type:complete len:405 (+),score=68.37 GILJ01003632.1:38-1252(+)